jgi:uncharacterized Zn finger protein
MARLCDQKTGLFPSPDDISFSCSCPDWASMCKHVAAVLYGIGARLDHRPDLLFTLRQVAHEELIAKAGASLSASPKAGTKVLAEEDLSAMFGIEIATASENSAGPGAKPKASPARRKRAGASKPTSVRIPKSASAAARIRATKPRSPIALKRAIAKQLKDRGEEIRRSRKP